MAKIALASSVICCFQTCTVLGHERVRCRSTGFGLIPWPFKGSLTGTEIPRSCRFTTNQPALFHFFWVVSGAHEPISHWDLCNTGRVFVLFQGRTPLGCPFVLCVFKYVITIAVMVGDAPIFKMEAMQDCVCDRRRVWGQSRDSDTIKL